MHANALQDRRILVIDDNPAIHEDFKKILCAPARSVEFSADEALLFGSSTSELLDVGFDVDSAFQGEEGLEKVQKAVMEGRPYAMAFIDGRMPPGWDGVETIAHIWKIYPDLQVVICTAYSDYSWEDITKRVGSTDSLVILKKPFDNVEARQLAHALTRKWVLNREARAQMKQLNCLVDERTIELREANQQLTLTNQQLETVAVQAQVANRIKSEFLAVMTHELRTPMNGVMGMTDLLLHTALDVDQREYAETIRFSSESLLAILTNILEFTQIEDGKMVLELAPFNVSAEINHAVQRFVKRAAEKGLHLTVDCGSELPPACYGDATRFNQVLTNLIDNGIKFTDKGAVRIEVRREPPSGAPAGESIRISVIDTGIGVPADKSELVFEKFAQVDSSLTRKYSGSGLGLAICKKLVELMGGTIGLQSKPGEGTTFWFSLPIRHKDLADALQSLPLTGPEPAIPAFAGVR